MTSQVRQCGLFSRLVLLFLALRRPMLPGLPYASRVYRWRDPSLLRMCAFRLASQQTQAWKGEGMSQEDFMHKDECIVLDENDIVQGHANKYDCHRFNEKQVRPLLYAYRAAPIRDIECLLSAHRSRGAFCTAPSASSSSTVRTGSFCNSAPSRRLLSQACGRTHVAPTRFSATSPPRWTHPQTSRTAQFRVSLRVAGAW